jgi:hypothetical protein
MMLLEAAIQLTRVAAGGPPGKGPGSGHYDHHKGGGGAKAKAARKEKTGIVPGLNRPSLFDQLKQERQQAIQEQLRQSNHQSTVEYFHGTTTAALEEIKAEGLVPGHKGGGDDYLRTHPWVAPVDEVVSRPPSVFISPSTTDADFMADYVKQLHPGSEKVITKWDVPEPIAKKFKDDEFMDGGFRFEGSLKPDWLAAYKVDSHNWVGKGGQRVPDPDDVKFAAIRTVYAVHICLGGE